MDHACGSSFIYFELYRRIVDYSQGQELEFQEFLNSLEVNEPCWWLSRSGVLCHGYCTYPRSS